MRLSRSLVVAWGMVAVSAGSVLAQTTPDFAVTYDTKMAPATIAPLIGAGVALVLIVGLGWKLGFKLAMKLYRMISGGR